MALEAVIGVLGVLAALRLKGGVEPLSSTSLLVVEKELILAAVGVDKGSRLSGGRRSGWSDFLFTAGTAGGVSEFAPLPMVRPLRCCLESEDGVVDVFSRLDEGTGKAELSWSLVPVTEGFRPEKKGMSTRSLGDS